MNKEITAPAAHRVTIEAPEGGGGVLVDHLDCNGAPTFVPNLTGQPFVRAIDVIAATIHHRCPAGTAVSVDPERWIES